MKKVFMKIYNFKYDFIILSMFIIWAIIDACSISLDYDLLFNLCYSFVLIILFNRSIKSTVYSNNRYKSIIKSIYVLISLVIAPIVVSYFNSKVFIPDAPTVINLGISTQSVFYLISCRKEII